MKHKLYDTNVMIFKHNDKEEYVWVPTWMDKKGRWFAFYDPTSEMKVKQFTCPHCCDEWIQEQLDEQCRKCRKKCN